MIDPREAIPIKGVHPRTFALLQSNCSTRTVSDRANNSDKVTSPTMPSWKDTQKEEGAGVLGSLVDEGLRWVDLGFVEGMSLELLYALCFLLFTQCLRREDGSDGLFAGVYIVPGTGRIGAWGVSDTERVSESRASPPEQQMVMHHVRNTIPTHVTMKVFCVSRWC
jgi:hypothetical protein